MPKVHPTAIVEDGAKLESDVEIGAFSIVGTGVSLAGGVRVHSHVVITGATEIGEGTIIYPHVVIGGAPQFRSDKGTDTRIIIGAENVIREHVTISRGSNVGGGLTRVGNRGYFMAYSHIAHDCHIGDGVTFANGAQLGGHCEIGDGVNIGGLAAVQQFSQIGRNAFVGGVTGVPGDVIPYGMVWGDRARLQGLNLVGLKRRGLPRDRIYALRAAFRAMFYGEGSFAGRVARVAERWHDIPEIIEITRFIQSKRKRPLCMAARERGDSEIVAD